ncbi:MAG: T9SS type A sorting domain-containing protein [Ignavibacteriae bacterium]|nr:T9SS type A sorting domain-containing protein [Ignavibacteriota bacterium]
MKRLLVTFLLFVILSNSNLFSQTNPDNIEKMYYLCKVWGYLKYFHSEVAKGIMNWDSVLYKSITDVTAAGTKEEFNDVLLTLISKAGSMDIPTTQPPVIEDSLKYNLDLSWFNDDILSDEVKAELDTVKSRFREQTNYYIKPIPGAGNPNLTSDTAFRGLPRYPLLEVRLDALFRYWNIINYFYPYKNRIDQNWDSTLIEFIPKFNVAATELEYDFTVLELAAHINDSHAFTTSYALNIFEGDYYPPFNIKYVENETVVTHVQEGDTTIRVGDVIKIMDGIDINVIRDSLRKFTIGSNEATVNRNINNSIIQGENSFFNMTVENTDGTRKVYYSRKLSYIEFNEMIAPKGPIWKIIEGTNIGYVDLGRLEPDSVGPMFNDLWNTREIIFDIRNYPLGSIYNILNYLTTTPIPFVKFTIPYISYPGSFTWAEFSLGGEIPQPELYKGGITILFNEETQSHAEFTCMAFDFFPQTYKIGSQTAGADGNVSIIYLPGLVTSYFTGLGVYYPDGTETQRVGIIPDLEVKPTINGIRDGKDEVLEAAIKRITGVDEPIIEQSNLGISPNPMDELSVVSYKLENKSNVSLVLYNSIGCGIAYLVANELQNEGYHQISVNTGNLNSGMYYFVLRTGEKSEILKTLLIK